MTVLRASRFGVALCLFELSCASSGANFALDQAPVPAPGAGVETRPTRARPTLPPGPGRTASLDPQATAEAPSSLKPATGSDASGEPDIGAASLPVELSGQDFQEPVSATLAADSTATKHASLAPAACRSLVQQHNLPVKRDGRPTPGVATALRFTGPVHGVKFLTAGWKSPFGVMDCRLVLTLEVMAQRITKYQVSEVHMGTIYRRNSKLRSRKLSQHAHALAADIVAFKLTDGRLLSMEQHFSGELGEPVCGPDSRVSPATAEAVILRNLVCDLARAGLFHYMLTPNYDYAHRDHLHVDIKRHAKHAFIR